MATKGIEKTFLAAFLLLFGALALFLLVGNGWFFAIAVGCGVWCILGKVPQKWFPLALFLLSFATRLGAALLIHTPMKSDFLGLYDASVMLKNGDISFREGPYFQLWGYQSGFVAWQALLLNIWENPLMIKLVNCLMAAGINLMVYRIACEAAEERAARAAAVLYLIFLFPTTLVSVLTNQHASAFFLCLGLYLIVGSRFERLRLWRYPLAGLSLALGNCLRPEALIPLVAIAAYGIYRMIRDRGGLRRWIIRLALIFGVYFLVCTVASGAVKASGLNDHGLANNNPLWKFVTGLNLKTGGMYSAEDWMKIAPYIGERGITEEGKELERELIRERLQAPPDQLFKLFVDKLCIFWGDDALQWSLGHWEEKDEPVKIGPWQWTRTELYQKLRAFDRCVFYLILAFALAGVWKLCKGRDPEGLLAAFAAFAACCCFLIIEIQPRYAYLPQIFLCITAAAGIPLRCGRSEGIEEGSAA